MPRKPPDVCWNVWLQLLSIARDQADPVGARSVWGEAEEDGAALSCADSERRKTVEIVSVG